MNELGVITEIIKETDKNWRFIIENPLYNKINYIPGQLIQLAIKDPNDPNEVIARNYSLSSWPDGTNKLEIIVTNLVGGKMCDYLFNRAKVGDEVMYRGPMGIFTLPEVIDRDIYFVSTGSGISPFRSMVNYIAENAIPTQNIKLFFGTRTRKDICYWEEMKLIESLVDNFEFIPVLSREDWKGKKGYVHEHYLDLIDNRKEKPLVYFCGWSRMIDEGRNHLAERGFEMNKDIRIEIFG